MSSDFVFVLWCQLSGRNLRVPFGVRLSAAGTSSPQRCRCTDLSADLQRSRWQEGREEETCRRTDGELERVEGGVEGGGVIFTSPNHIQWMCAGLIYVWLVVLKHPECDGAGRGRWRGEVAGNRSNDAA